MSQMLELAARAAQNAGPDSCLRGLALNEAMSIARAVLMAVRGAGPIQTWEGSVQYVRAKSEGHEPGEAANLIYTAMIDAILNEVTE